MMNKNDLALITAASSGHFRSLLQFLKSVRRYEPNIPCIVYSLGLKDNELNKLKAKYPDHEVRIFDFLNYPPHFAMERNNGAYAWKPAIISEVLIDRKGPVCWMDSGNTLVSSLDSIRSALERVGFYSPYSPGTIAQWTHPGLFTALGVESSRYTEERNLNGACIAFDPRNELAGNLANTWLKYSLSEQCIAPSGSDRSNHRYDQALLSVLAYQAGLADVSEHVYLGFKPHQDVEVYPLRALLRSFKRTLEYWRYRIRGLIFGFERSGL